MSPILSIHTITIAMTCAQPAPANLHKIQACIASGALDLASPCMLDGSISFEPFEESEEAATAHANDLLIEYIISNHSGLCTYMVIVCKFFLPHTRGLLYYGARLAAADHHGGRRADRVC